MAPSRTIPQNIRRVRASRGLSQGDVAAKAGLSRNAYRSIETGQAEPRVSSLQGIARALDVPLPELLTEPPSLSSVRVRSAKPRTNHAQARRDEVVVRVARWLADFNGIEQLLGEAQPCALDALPARLKKLSGEDRPVKAARMAREALELQPDEPIRDVCGLLESAGVKVWPAVMDPDDFFGLSVAAPRLSSPKSGDGGPAVVVNVRDDISVERRIFTAAHELGHLLLHPGAYDVDKVNEDEGEEKEADLFASHFLMPNDVFGKEWRDTYGLPFVDRVLHVKRLFRVSYQTVLFRLVELGQADGSKIWMIFKAQWKRRSGKPLGKKDEPMALEEVDFLEDRLSRLVRQALEAEKISLSRAAEILGMDLNAMREMVASWEVAA
jgi:Zn-dependent peptidase ImmA (M78 family)/DNA-binding XRE family transcriptional regulator